MANDLLMLAIGLIAGFMGGMMMFAPEKYKKLMDGLGSFQKKRGKQTLKGKRDDDGFVEIGRP